MLYERALRYALRDLHNAVMKVYRNGRAKILDRPRKFYFCDNVMWPSPVGFTGFFVRVDEESYSLSDDFDVNELVSEIIGICEEDPRKVLFALRRIRAAVDWCMAVAGGEK